MISPINRKEETAKAIEISQKFEGASPWANITGDFDGAGLTCGALGWTIRWDNQDPLVNEFMKRHGGYRIMELMPKKWSEYLEMIKEPESTAIGIVKHWSDGETMHEPYGSELKAFWTSPEMKEIQVEFAETDMGAFAEKWSIDFCNHFGFEFSSTIFQWFFDVAVHNGGMKNVTFDCISNFTYARFEEWANSLAIPWRFRSTKEDLLHNISVWKGNYEAGTLAARALFALSLYRADVSNYRFIADVMNRKGTIAIGAGYVHGDFYNL